MANFQVFQDELESMISHFRMYEDKSNQSAALAEVPHEYLMAIAQAKYESSEKAPNSNSAVPPDEQNIVRDMFLLELMDWFKNTFFTWMDSPECPFCNQPTTAVGHGTPTPLEIAQSANRIEIFTCRNCFQDNREVARFPRYNHPATLLKSRRGRCGEWANCFALICRSVGFEVRHVRDWTDHVWVEVFSCSLRPNRWIHADPCENSYDSPLLYSSGWGKKLSYVIAASQDDIQDVTWRYIQENSLSEVLSRRRLIGEAELVQTMMRMKARLQSSLSPERKSLLELRMVEELVEFIYPRGQTLKESEKVGRESGGLAWRLARQELGDGNDTNIRISEQFVWNITDQNVHDSKFIMAYDCGKDRYFLTNKDSSREVKFGWKSGIYESSNVFRKEERDWKMAYLAINENSSTNQGTISWQFHVTDLNREICAVKSVSSISIFNEAANISVALTDDTGTSFKLVETNQSKVSFKWNSKDTDGERKKFKPCRTLTLTCTLTGGNGNTGWQHAQLFRTSMTPNSTECIGLKVELDINSTT